MYWQHYGDIRRGLKFRFGRTKILVCVLSCVRYAEGDRGGTMDVRTKFIGAS